MRTFWDKQPVPQDGQNYEGGKEIEKEHVVVETPHELPEGFVWCEPELKEAHTLINEYYVCDETFRLSYSFDTFKWAAEAPGYKNIGIRENDTNDLIGYISSVPNKVRVCDDVLDMVQVNFLCVHEKFRSMGFVPLLISEMKRIANTNGIWQAYATAVAELPGSIVKSRYWHRFLNVKNLMKTGFYKTDRPREKYFEVRGNSQCRQ